MIELEDAISYACELHKGQKDKGGNPYILHLLHVMSQVDSLDEKIVAVMHDSKEDTHITDEQLYQHGFSSKQIEAIDALTKRKGESRIQAAQRAAQNDLALKVKIADVRHNMDTRRLIVITHKDLERQAEYEQVLKFLESKI